MSGSGAKAKSKEKAGFQQQVWGGQGGHLQNLYGQAAELFGDTNSQMQEQIPGAIVQQQQVASQANPAWQNQMQGGAYKDMGLQQQLMGSLNQSMNNPTAMQDINGMIMGGDGNNYADAMKASYQADAGRAQDQMLQTMDARATASGMSGGSRHGTAIGQGMRDINQNLQSNLAQTGYNTFDKDLDRKMQIAQQADQGTLQRQQLMGGMIGQQQNTMNTGLAGGANMQNLNMGQFAPQMMPWEALSGYSNAIGRPTVLSSGQSKASANSKSAGGGVGGSK